MDNCDLEKLTISGARLQPNFSPNITNYKVTVGSSVENVNLDLMTSDCSATFTILTGDHTKVIPLNTGLNKVEIEVVAEDGTTKKYAVDITRLSAKIAELSELALSENTALYPPFTPKSYEYSCGVSFYRIEISVTTKVPDKLIKVTVNGEGSFKPILLNYGDTLIEICVCSADGSFSQTYKVLVTRQLIPVAVTFTDRNDQLDFECPVSLSAFYRPVSINRSKPKSIFSRLYIEMLTRRSKVDPLTDCPLGEDWRVCELELDKKLSSATVQCFFHYRGCESVVNLSALGSHSLDCPHKPTGDLDAKEVTERSWYKENFESTKAWEIETKHNCEIRHWEKKLQMPTGDETLEKLCEEAENQLKEYRKNLPKAGESFHPENAELALQSLEQAAACFATAISLKFRDARLHFQLGLTLEEQHYATEFYGLRKKTDKGKDELSDAKSKSLQDDILGVCRLHGFGGVPTVENQLKALDKELQLLKDQGQSSKTDYVQTLYLWLSKKHSKDSNAVMQDEESFVHRALVKYLDAWSLCPDDWEFSLHVGRLLLLQGRNKEALQHLQSGLALRPLHAGLRFFTGLALLRQEQKPSEKTEKEAALFLHQGLELYVSRRCNVNWEESDASEPLSCLNTQFLRGLLTLGNLQQQNALTEKSMSAEQVYHIMTALTAQSVSQCAMRGDAIRQLEWVLLDVHFALLQRLNAQSKDKAQAKVTVAKRCQGLSALIRLTTIPACQELLDIQEKTCQLAVVTTPRDGHALCLLGLAQLAQFDAHPNSESGREARMDACLSFQASIELEGKLQSGEPLDHLTKQRWWVDWNKKANPSSAPPAKDNTMAIRGAPKQGRGGPVPVQPAAGKPTAPPGRGAKAFQPPSKTPAARGRGAPVPAAAKPANAEPKAQVSKPKEESPKPVETPEVPQAPSGQNVVNRRSHVPRLGLARVFSHSADTLDQAIKLYKEVISMAPTLHDAYIELAQILEPSDRLAAVEVYCRFPLRPAPEQSFDDAFITGEIVRMLMSAEQYEHPQLGPSLVAHAKVMGMPCIEKYIDILDSKSKITLVKTVYANYHDKDVDDPELADFFRFKCWI